MTAVAEGQGAPPPDCLWPFTITTNNGTVGPLDNRTNGCNTFTLWYQSGGFSPVSLQLNQADGVNSPGSFTIYAGTVDTGTNPLTSAVKGQATFTGPVSWLQVALTATGTGTIRGVLYGYKTGYPGASSGGGGGSCNVSTFTDGAVLFVEMAKCAEDVANFNYDLTDHLVQVGGSPLTPHPGLFVGPDESTLDPDIQGDVTPGQLTVVTTAPDSTYTAGISVERSLATIAGGGMYGIAVGTLLSGSAGYNQGVFSNPILISSATGDAYGYEANPQAALSVSASNLWSFASEPAVDSTSFVDNVYSFPFRNIGQILGTITNMYGLWSEATGPIAANAFPVWLNDQGVFVIHATNAFDSVFQDRPALYNPLFAQFTPGATNLARCIPGCQWETNVAYYGTEAAGTGVDTRVAWEGLGMDLLWGDVPLPFRTQKNTVSAVAPGAGLADMRWLAGTNSGTCKLVSNAGTSATEVTIIDNVGSGC